MLDRVDNSLKAAAKALREVVAPAVDPGVPQAGEQVRFATELIEIVRWQLRHLAERDAAELLRYTELAESVLARSGALDDVAVEPLRSAVGEARGLGAAGSRWHEEVHQAVDRLRTGISLVVTAAQDAPAEVRDTIERAVISGSKPLVDLDRAWYLPFGLDPAPADVTPFTERT